MVVVQVACCVGRWDIGKGWGDNMAVANRQTAQGTRSRTHTHRPTQTEAQKHAQTQKYRHTYTQSRHAQTFSCGFGPHAWHL